MNKSEDLIKKIKLMKSNKFYRLGDLIYGKGMRWKQDREVILGSDYYKGSLLRNYLEGLNKPNQTRFESKLWSSIVKNKIIKNNIKISDDSLCIHVRAGDVVSNNAQAFNKLLKSCNNENELKKITDGSYYCWSIISQKKIYDKIDIKLQEKKFKNATIVTGFHFGDNELINKFHFSEDALDVNKALFKILFDKIQGHYDMKIFIPQEDDEVKNIDNHLLYLISCKNKILDSGSPSWTKIVNDTKL